MSQHYTTGDSQTHFDLLRMCLLFIVSACSRLCARFQEWEDAADALCASAASSHSSVTRRSCATLGQSKRWHRKADTYYEVAPTEAEDV